jgi:hypothetical protein
MCSSLNRDPCGSPTSRERMRQATDAVHKSKTRIAADEQHRFVCVDADEHRHLARVIGRLWVAPRFARRARSRPRTQARQRRKRLRSWVTALRAAGRHRRPARNRNTPQLAAPTRAIHDDHGRTQRNTDSSVLTCAQLFLGAVGSGGMGCAALRAPGAQSPANTSASAQKSLAFAGDGTPGEPAGTAGRRATGTRPRAPAAHFWADPCSSVFIRFIRGWRFGTAVGFHHAAIR